MTTYSDVYQLVGVYFMTKISIKQTFILNEMNDLNNRFFATSNFVWLNPFAFKKKKIPEFYTKIKQLSQMKPARHNRILYIPTSRFIEDFDGLIANDFNNDLGTVKQILAGFNPDVSFFPILNNLVFFVKGEKHAMNKSEISSKIIKRFKEASEMRNSNPLNLTTTPLKVFNFSSSFE